MAELNVNTLNMAMASNPPIYLHVHPSMVNRAQSIVEEHPPHGRRTQPIVVADEKLGINEWFLISSIRSKDYA